MGPKLGINAPDVSVLVALWAYATLAVAVLTSIALVAHTVTKRHAKES